MALLEGSSGEHVNARVSAKNRVSISWTTLALTLKLSVLLSDGENP